MGEGLHAAVSSTACSSCFQCLSISCSCMHVVCAHYGSYMKRSDWKCSAGTALPDTRARLWINKPSITRTELYLTVTVKSKKSGRRHQAVCMKFPCCGMNKCKFCFILVYLKAANLSLFHKPRWCTGPLNTELLWILKKKVNLQQLIDKLTIN